jgi:hypothetical protein
MDRVQVSGNGNSDGETREAQGRVWILDICSLLCHVSLRQTTSLTIEIDLSISSCGTMTEGDYSVNVVGDRSCHNIKTTQNFCQTTVWKNKNGNAGGVALFVAIDCDKGTPLGFCKQDPVYLKPGVARDPSVNANFVDAHFDKDPSKAILGTATAACERNQWPPA